MELKFNGNLFSETPGSRHANDFKLYEYGIASFYKEGSVPPVIQIEKNEPNKILLKREYSFPQILLLQEVRIRVLLPIEKIKDKIK